MLSIRKAEERGKFKNDWLDTKYSFSFSNYYNPKYTGFSHCLVINDDIISPSGGFGMHGHENMEIVTYVIEGELAHKDSLGNVETIRAGEIQRMSAGTGIRHSEFNYSDSKPCRLLQIWFLPKDKNIEPGYQQKDITESRKLNQFNLVVGEISGNDEKPSNIIGMNQNVNIYATLLEAGNKLTKTLNSNAKYWLQIAKGDLVVNNLDLFEGDGLAINGESELEIESLRDADFLLFEMY